MAASVNITIPAQNDVCIPKDGVGNTFTITADYDFGGANGSKKIQWIVRDSAFNELKKHVQALPANNSGTSTYNVPCEVGKDYSNMIISAIIFIDGNNNDAIDPGEDQASDVRLNISSCTDCGVVVVPPVIEEPVAIAEEHKEEKARAQASATEVKLIRWTNNEIKLKSAQIHHVYFGVVVQSKMNASIRSTIQVTESVRRGRQNFIAFLNLPKVADPAFDLYLETYVVGAANQVLLNVPRKKL